MTEVTILMPCLNEAETLARCITKAMGFLQRAGIDGEVVIADNGSTDGSQAIAESLGARVVPVPRRGYGAALLAGTEAAKGRYVIVGDSDDSYDFSALDAFVAELRKGADLVVGNRFKGGIAPGAMPKLHRYFGNPLLTFITRALFRTPIRDIHCGLRGYRRDRMIGLKLTTLKMEHLTEMAIKATLAGWQIVEVPTTLSPDGRSRAPHLKSWSDGWLNLKFTLTLAPFMLFLYPGIALLALGLPVFAALMFGPIHLGGVTFSIGTLIFAATAAITGFQLLWFHLLARSFSVRFGVLPGSARFARLQQGMSVDGACKAGAALLALAATTTAVSVGFWASTGFGELQMLDISRAATLVAVLAALGVQAITNGFLWGLLNQRLPEGDAAETQTAPVILAA